MHLRALTHSSVCSVISDLSMQDRNAPKAKDMNQRFLLLPTAPEGILRHYFLFTSNIQIMTTLETCMEPSSMSLSTTVPFQHSPGRHITVYFNAWNNMSQRKVLLHHFNMLFVWYIYFSASAVMGQLTSICWGELLLLKLYGQKAKQRHWDWIRIQNDC